MKTAVNKHIKSNEIDNSIEDNTNELIVPDSSILFFYMYVEEFAPFDVNGMPSIHNVTFFPDVHFAIKSMVYKN